MSVMDKHQIDPEHFKKFFSFFIGSFSGLCFSFGTIYFLNIKLNKESIGYYSYIFNLLNLIYPLISLNVSNGYVRFITVYRNDLLINYVRKLSYIAALLFALLIWLWSGRVYFTLLAFIILYQEQLILARAQLNMVKFNFLNVIQKLLFLAILLICQDIITAEIALIVLGISYFISYLLALLWSSKPKTAPLGSALDQKIFLKFCFITVLTMLVNWVLTVSDQIIIKHFFGYEALAPYAVASRIIMTLSVIAGIFLSYYPAVYFRDINGKKYKEIFLLRKYFISILFICSSILFVLKDSIYMIFGASEYIKESNFFLPLLLGEVCRLIASIWMTFMTYKLQQKTILFSMFFISLLNVALNIAFIPVFGTIASAYSTFGCFLIYMFASFVLSYIPEKQHIKSLLLQNN